MNINKPVLLIDEGKCRANIQRMASLCAEKKMSFRPHFKTHQSLAVGKWFKEVGVSKIAVSSLSMADYFSKEWNDILVAFPTNVLEDELINHLAQRIHLNILVESLETISLLADVVKFPLTIYVEIDTGYHRTGVYFDDYQVIDSILEVIKNADCLSFGGFITHSGHSYDCLGKEEVLSLHHLNKSRFLQVKSRYIADYPHLIISYGDTPTTSIADDFDGVDELRPGNFVCYDVTQVQIGSCDFNQIAVVLACPVVSIHKERGEIIIYGGSVHLSKDSLKWQDKGLIYGLLAEKTEEGWGEPIENALVYSLSQEHGKIKMNESELLKYNVWQIVYIYPVHSCLVISSMRGFTTLRGEILDVYRGL